MYLISEQLLNLNRSHEPLSPIGFEIHSTDNTQDTAQKEHDYYNSRNLKASVHYFAGTQIIRCVPENEVANHAGQTANHKYLSVEMCEGEPFAEVWARTVWLVADACVRYGWTTGPDVWSHRGTSNKWHETDHQDPIAYLARNGKTWDQLLAAIDSEIVRLKNPKTQEVIDMLVVAVLLFTKDDFWSGADVVVKNGNCAMFIRPVDHSVPKDAMSANKLIVVGGATVNHPNEVLLSGDSKYDTAAAVAKYLG